MPLLPTETEPLMSLVRAAVPDDVEVIQEGTTIVIGPGLERSLRLARNPQDHRWWSTRGEITTLIHSTVDLGKALCDALDLGQPRMLDIQLLLQGAKIREHQESVIATCTRALNGDAAAIVECAMILLSVREAPSA